MKPTISIFGNFQNGKSTLINCLLESDLAKVGGFGLSVTRNITRYTYGPILQYAIRKSDGSENSIVNLQELDTLDYNDELIVYSPSIILQSFDLVDTPGYNACEYDSGTADYNIRNTDFAIILIHNKGLSEDEKRLAKKISSSDIPFIVVMNCYNDILDHWNPVNEGNLAIVDNVQSELNYIRSTLLPKGIFVTNLIWYWLSIDASNNSMITNKSIARCSKLLNNFWNDYSTEEYSPTAIAEMSQFLNLHKFLCGDEFSRYIQSLKIINDALDEIRNAIEIYKSKQTNRLNKIISEIEDSYRNSHDLLKIKLLNEIKQYEESQAENERIMRNEVSKIGRFLALSRQIISKALDPRLVIKAKIFKSKQETEDVIQFLESIKTK